MIHKCDSCKYRDERNEWCAATTNLANAVSGGKVLKCGQYRCATIIERDDDGTERCGCCGKLHWGWDKACPECGADYRR